MTPAVLLLRRTFGTLVLLSVAAGVTTGFVSARKNPGVDVALTLTVPLPTRQAPQRDRSGGNVGETTFEALQSAELFAETLSGWLSSPDFVAAVYQRAGLKFPRATVRRLSRAFTAVKRGGPVADVHFHAPSAADGQALARAVITEIQERTTAFNAAAEDLTFRVTASDPLVAPVLVSPLLRGVVAGIVALVIGINLVLLNDFLRSPPDASAGGTTAS
ncbi:MAG: Uncharacterized protein G01um101438_72 [Parcubacteria group bacterium Gr01-1014_38]|nr:MAG: Uncharacterized protein G01um101438_72 [Parcubacteria group bacterium Gr01-1014_38]